MNLSPASHLRLTDRLRRDWYVSKVDFHAQDVPAGHRKGLRRELRSDLTAAAGDVGMSRAVEDLGPASALAHEFVLAQGRRLPHVWTGILTFAVILFGWAGMVLATLNALTNAAEQIGGDRTVSVHADWLGTTITITHGPTLAGAIEFSFLTVAVFVLIPLIAARAWRYRPAWLQRRLASRTLPARTDPLV